MSTGEQRPEAAREIRDELADTIDRNDPRFGNGALFTKWFTHEIDEENLDRSTLYLSYSGETKDDNHTTFYNVRTAFNNQSTHSADSPFWFAEATAKTRGARGSWAFRGIFNPRSYFLASYKHHFAREVDLKYGVEAEIGGDPRHFIKASKYFKGFGLRLKAIVSGQLNSLHNIVDTVSFIPEYKLRFRDDKLPIKKVNVSLRTDLSVGQGLPALRRKPILETDVRLKAGHLNAEVTLEPETLDSEITFYHGLYKRAGWGLGLYLNYEGSLRKFDGQQTGGLQVRVPDFGKIRTTVDNHSVLKNSIFYQAHPFATIIQYTQLNLQNRHDVRFGLGLTLGE